MNRRILPLLLLLALVLTACGAQEAAPTEPPSPSPTTQAEPTPTPAPEPAAETIPVEKINPLTGLPLEGEITAAQRPVAIMLNNIREALPQQGNSCADVIYECLAEGGITRMLGVFQSVEGVGEIGSIRSSRPYYLDLALGLDAIYIHAGGSDEAYADISKWKVTSLDFVRSTAYNAIFWRDQGRIRNNGLEHSVLTSGEKITANFPNYSFRKDHAEGYSLPYTFAEDGTPAGGESAETLTVPFSNYKTGVFRYDAESGLYKVEEYGKPLIDGNDGVTQVAVTNVVVIRTSCKAIDDYGRMRVDLYGHSGDGWFACGGKMVPITWEKKDLNSPLTYALADGSPVVFGQGKSYVNIIPLSNSVTAQ